MSWLRRSPGPGEAPRAPAVSAPAARPVPTIVRHAPDVRIDVRWEVASAPAADEPVVHALVTLTPQGDGLVHASAGPVAHVVLALDLSASMCRPDKYPMLQRALGELVRELRGGSSAEVLLTVVAFGRGAEFVMRAESSRRVTERSLLDAVQASPLLFTNYTDVAGALKLCAVAAAESHRADRRLPVRIVVLTDGRPQDVPLAESRMETLRRLPADVDCLCFGEDADVEAMKALVCGGRGGTVKHVGPDSIEEAFGRIAEVAQRIVAKRALVDLELRDDVAGGRAYRFRPGRHDFGPGAFVDGAHFATDLGSLEAGRAYSLLFRLRLPATPHEETEVGRLAVRIPGVGGPQLFEALLSLPRHAGGPAPSADPFVRQALDILGAGADADPAAVLASLLARRELHAVERRDARSAAVIDKAIALLESGGSLDALTPAERAVLQAHTRTVHAAAAVR